MLADLDVTVGVGLVCLCKYICDGVIVRSALKGGMQHRVCMPPCMPRAIVLEVAASFQHLEPQIQKGNVLASAPPRTPCRRKPLSKQPWSVRLSV
jgi:hypothetical protein